MSEAFAVLNGRTPLVDYHSQYAQLVPYLAAGAMHLSGTSVGSWTDSCRAQCLALLGVCALLRRLVGGSLLALAPFAPFVAAGVHTRAVASRHDRVFSLWPLRYGGP